MEYKYIPPALVLLFVMYDSLAHRHAMGSRGAAMPTMLLTYHDSVHGCDERGMGTEAKPYKTLVKERVPVDSLAVLRAGSYEIPEAVYREGGLSVSSLPGEKVSIVVVNSRGGGAATERVTYYSSKAGSNANDGSSAGKAKRTLKGVVGGKAILARGAYWLGNGDFTHLVFEASDGCVVNFVGSYPDMPLKPVTPEEDVPYADTLAQLHGRRERMLAFMDRTGINPFVEEKHIRELFISSGLSFQFVVSNYYPDKRKVRRFNRYLQIEDLVLKSAEELAANYAKEHPETRLE